MNINNNLLVFEESSDEQQPPLPKNYRNRAKKQINKTNAILQKGLFQNTEEQLKYSQMVLIKPQTQHKTQSKSDLFVQPVNQSTDEILYDADYFEQSESNSETQVVLHRRKKQEKNYQQKDNKPRRRQRQPRNTMLYTPKQDNQEESSLQDLAIIASSEISEFPINQTQKSQQQAHSPAKTKPNKEKKKSPIKQQLGKYIDSKQINESPHQFCKAYIPQGKTMRTKIIRDRSGLNTFWPQYNMQFTNKTHCMSAKKKPGNATSNYYISLSKENVTQMDSNCIAKLRSNFSGTIYNVFNPGINPQEAAEDTSLVREMRATITYSSIPNMKTPRNLQVYMLLPEQEYRELEGIDNWKEEPNLQELYEKGDNKNKIIFLTGRNPKWSQKMGGFLLNFDGRVTKASVKNFILQNPQTQQQALMFGRLDEDLFTMDISYPLTPQIAFAVALTQFQSKLLIV